MERCSTTVILNGTLIDGSGKPPEPNEALVIEGHRIRSTGSLPADIRIEDQDQVQVIDASGQWILPGLIDGHCHLSFGYPEMPGVPFSQGTNHLYQRAGQRPVLSDCSKSALSPDVFSLNSPYHVDNHSFSS